MEEDHVQLNDTDGMADQDETDDQSVCDSPPSSHEEVLRDDVNFIQNMSQFFNQESLHDIILTVANQRYFAHKFVLAKSSEVFRKLLYEKTWVEGESKEIALSETPECTDVFEPFLKYLYTAEVCINTDTAVGILCLADKYNVTSLKDLCVGFMVDRARSPNVQIALMWYPWAKALHLPDLLNQCTRTIAWNFYEVTISPSWLTMDLEFLMDLLKCSELVVPDEFSLWQGVEQWLLQPSMESTLSENANQLLPLVRFPMMLVHQLYYIETSELYDNEASRSVLLSLLSKAYRFRSLCPSQTKLQPSISFSDVCYQPREYTSLRVHTIQMQNTMRLNQVDVKMFKGAVPSEVHDADWRITYRKCGETWQLQLYCHETGLGIARIQPTLFFCNSGGKVIQVHREDIMVLNRGKTADLNVTMDEPTLTKSVDILLKPVPV